MSLQRALEDLYEPRDAFLRRVRSELLLHRKTLYQLWKVSALDVGHFYRVFRGERIPSLETCVRLDEALGRLLDGE